MKLIDKIKNAIFEDPEPENENLEETKRITTPVFQEEEVVKKIDIEKTIPKKIELPKEEYVDDEKVVEEPKPVFPKREHRMTPVIFDDDDFIMEDEPITPIVPREERKDNTKKPLYSGYRDDKQKEKFKPSPILSPVYGFVGVSPVLEQPRKEEISSYNEMFAKEKKEEVTLDTVRQKAYGIAPQPKEEDDDLGLLYDMKQDETPAISRITLGDAEEYFDDLGLEYNVDYKDTAKGKANIQEVKNEEETITELEDEIFQEPKEKIETTRELEITKEQMRPKTAKEIKKVTKITDSDIEEPEEETNEPDEKNLYDLIDMMYESKE